LRHLILKLLLKKDAKLEARAALIVMSGWSGCSC
jgi:hypothetical protein